MKTIKHLLALLLLTVASGATWAQSAAACPQILDQKLTRLQDDAPQNLCQYAGKVALVVNTASYCGFTKQYEGLEALHAKYQARGLTVLGFPSNDFGQQGADSGKQIAEFCYNTYGVKFPMFSKSSVKGPNANPFYSALTKASGKAPEWNFNKYLIDRDGKIIGFYPSEVTPQNKTLVAAIEKALDQKK
jgi:glutathione peroxidase